MPTVVVELMVGAWKTTEQMEPKHLEHITIPQTHISGTRLIIEQTRATHKNASQQDLKQHREKTPVFTDSNVDTKDKAYRYIL